MSKTSPKNIWQGRQDTEDGQLGLRWHQALMPESKDAELGIVGFACDLGVIANKGREGAKDGPDAVKSALANLAWHGSKGFYDYGNIIAPNGLSTAQKDYASAIDIALTNHPFVIGLGGGHEIAWGSFLGLQAYLQQRVKKVGIINFDAHFDLRKPAPDTSSGTPFYQISEFCNQQNMPFHYACLGVAKTANTKALFARADKLKVNYLSDLEFCVEGAKSKLTGFLQNIDCLYLSVCLDVFNGSDAPGVSAPATLGIEVKQVIELLHWIAQSQSKLGFEWKLADIAEMNPKFDKDKQTAKLAARLVFEMHQAMVQ